MTASHDYSEKEFEAMVRDALDELPAEFQRAIESVPVVVSDRGEANHAYGMYVGFRRKGASWFAPAGLPDEIMIFRDTLVRDFGDDPQRLRAQVKRVVRHEVGHFLGFDEDGVRELGL
jgi:predicted Zn-dependent protease with MMP-like domain